MNYNNKFNNQTKFADLPILSKGTKFILKITTWQQECNTNEVADQYQTLYWPIINMNNRITLNIHDTGNQYSYGRIICIEKYTDDMKHKWVTQKWQLKRTETKII